MRISFTALTGSGPRDVVVNVDSEATVEGVARSLAALDGRPQIPAPASPRTPYSPGARTRPSGWTAGCSTRRPSP
ncbi:hypothetical protein [Actinomadura madurae]|uniref:hypothetical protein n=1 Tax=Actinomadura madurae TaxID=1993 RepID=UPI0020D2147C|nr:hypothetical protein [Actinomadura madurae]MCP9950643.1 hypothetical protein [Actinomadura madurae]MCQ0016085.1 hypothetical protein [Actinomadura madurae]